MNAKLLISLIESIYLIYMFNFFKTNIDFNVFASPTNHWFKHLTGNEYGVRICLFGQILSIPVHYYLLRVIFINHLTIIQHMEYILRILYMILMQLYIYYQFGLNY